MVVLPEHPVTLSAQQVEQLNAALSRMRHDINNHLSILMAAADLAGSKPEKAQEYLTTILERPAIIGKLMLQFSKEFEAAIGIKRPDTLG